jgi:hypothetical protein
MKKLRRDAEQFGVLELFANMGTQYGYDIRDPASSEDFIEHVRHSLEQSKAKDTVIHGQRTESLFAYIVGALGKAVLAKQEDVGDVFFVGEVAQPPDYRVTFDDGTQLLIEVKNCHQRNPKAKLKISKSYYQKLSRYAELNRVELKFAVFYSRWNKWSLLSIDAFVEHDKYYQIDMLDALKRNEMIVLGDMMIGTAPDLELHFLANPDEACDVDKNGEAKFVIRDVKLVSAGKKITNENEKKLACFFMQYGDWNESSCESFIVDNKFYGIKFVYSPEHQKEPNFAIIGNLSSMVTNAFRHHTVEDGAVMALKLGLDPASFEVAIPHDYSGEQLPLWRFQMSPNKD